MRKGPKGGMLDPIDDEINRIIAMVCAKVEHPHRIRKLQFGHVKTCYLRLANNRAQLCLIRGHSASDSGVFGYPCEVILRGDLPPAMVRFF